MALRRARDHGVRHREDGFGRSVVLLQLDHAGPGKVLRKLEDVADHGRPKGVDGLRVVPDGHDLGAGSKARQDVGLERVRVLVFVHQDVVEQTGHPMHGGR